MLFLWQRNYTIRTSQSLFIVTAKGVGVTQFVIPQRHLLGDRYTEKSGKDIFSLIKYENLLTY